MAAAAKTAITIGLSKIEVGEAKADGSVQQTLAKIGMTYKDTCKVSQEQSEVIEHYEEGASAPVVRKLTKKIPKIEFSLIVDDVKLLANYIGGKESGGTWSFSGSDKPIVKAIKITPEQGLEIYVPNADIEATLDADLSSKGIMLVRFVVTPLAVTGDNGAVQCKLKG